VSTAVDVYLEAGARKTFACAVDWPGWCRSGRDEAQALEALASYADRYRAVYELLGLKALAQKDGALEISGTFGLRESKPGYGRPAAGEPVPQSEDPTPDG